MGRARPLRPGRARGREPARRRLAPTASCSTGSPSASRESPRSAPSVASAPLALVAAPDLELALRLADAFAPEHLELACAGADAGVGAGRVAGCVFVGAGGATAFGDYAAGSNHVLPTGGAARFGGPLGPRTFLRRTSVVSVPKAAASALAPHVDAIAESEGFPVHGESAAARAPGAGSRRED